MGVQFIVWCPVYCFLADGIRPTPRSQFLAQAHISLTRAVVKGAKPFIQWHYATALVAFKMLVVLIVEITAGSQIKVFAHAHFLESAVPRGGLEKRPDEFDGVR